MVMQKEEAMDKSRDPAVQQMIARAEAQNVTTVWDRYAAMTPQCGFGDTGLCCRHCCRALPYRSVRRRSAGGDLRRLRRCQVARAWIEPSPPARRPTPAMPGISPIP